MSPENDRKDAIELSSLNDHLANERTFLAWIRTSIAIMAFGFVVEKFTLFMKQISLFFLTKSDSTAIHSISPDLGYSSILGISLVALGTSLCFLSFVKFKYVQSQIQKKNFQQSYLLEIMLALSIFAMGVFLCIYLLAHQ